MTPPPFLSVPKTGNYGGGSGGGSSNSLNSAGSSNSRSGKPRSVDFSPSLSPIDSEMPHSPSFYSHVSSSGGNSHGTSVAWDSEADHILSYFLSGDARGMEGNVPEFFTVASRADPFHGDSIADRRNVTTANLEDINNNFLPNNLHDGGDDRIHKEREQGDQGDSNDRHQMDGDYPKVPPPTPAVHFYSRSSATPQGGTLTMVLQAGHTGSGSNVPDSTGITGNNSSSSLSSMAAALVSGGPLVLQKLQTQSQLAHGLQPRHAAPFRSAVSGGNDSPMVLDYQPSPLSPAALIGAGHENLMLPPASRVPSQENMSTSTTTSPVLLQQQEQQPLQQQAQSTLQQPVVSERERHEQHLAWLRDINAMAKVAAMNGGRMVPPPHPSLVLQEPTPATSHVVVPPTLPTNPQGLPMHGHGMSPMMGYISIPGGPSGHHMMAHHAHPFLFHPAAMAAVAAGMQVTSNVASVGAASSIPAVESEEKRAKRLERNRESARKSRRKKRERLETLEARVNALYVKLEHERRNQINKMVPYYRQSRSRQIKALIQQAAASASPDDSSQQMQLVDLSPIIVGCGPYSSMSRSVQEFQLNQIKQLTLPYYHRTFLWTTVHGEKFFAVGKEDYARREIERQGSTGGAITAPSPSAAASGPSSSASTATTASGSSSTTGTAAANRQVIAVKISSKQIGDELLGGGNRTAATTVASKKAAAAVESNWDGPGMNCRVDDLTKVWPLFCSELRISVEQEDQFVSVYRRIRENQGDTLAHSRAQLVAAVHTADVIHEATMKLSHRVGRRDEQAYLNILKPLQLAQYQEWITRNKGRIDSFVGSRYKSPSRRIQDPPEQGMGVSSAAQMSSELSTQGGTDLSLQYTCQRIKEVLQISDSK